MINLGQKVEFDPLYAMSFYGIDAFRTNVTGTVVEVHKDHGWFLVEYGDEEKVRMGFKFDDIGETVKILEG